MLCATPSLFPCLRTKEWYKVKRAILLSACVKLQGELRKQLELDFSMKARIYDLRQVQEFQTVVLEEIGKAAPEVQRRITERLVEVNAARSALEFRAGCGM